MKQFEELIFIFLPFSQTNFTGNQQFIAERIAKMSYFLADPTIKQQRNNINHEPGQTPTFSQESPKSNYQYQKINFHQYIQRTNSPQPTFLSNMTSNDPQQRLNSNLHRNPNQLQHYETYENISNEYANLKNKVEDRIKLLQTKCAFLDQDPSRTRISFGSNADNNSNHVYQTKKSEENQPINGQIPLKNNYITHRRQQSSHTESHQNLSQQYLRAHCQSIDSNTVPYRSQQKISDTNQMLSFNRQPQVIEMGQTTKNISVLPSQSNTSQNTLLQHNLNEVMVENLKAQKQLNQNLKTLSQRLSDFSIRRSESSGYLEQYRRNSRADRSSRNQKVSNEDYGDCWKCEGLISSSRNTQKKSARKVNKYADQGYQSSSSESDQSYSNRNNAINYQAQRHRKNNDYYKSTHEGKNNHKTKLYITKEPSIKKEKRSNSNSNKLRNKSISRSSSSQNSNNKIYTFRGKAHQINVQPDHRKISTSKKQKRNRGKQEINSEYFDSKKIIRMKNQSGQNQRESPRKEKKRGQHGSMKGCCPIHGQDMMQLYKRKQKHKSKQIFKDSEHGNRKHEKQHLLQSFQQQQKLRNELVHKIGKSFFNSYGVK